MTDDKTIAPFGEIALGGERIYRVVAGGLDLFLAVRTATGHGRAYALGERLGPGAETPCLPADDEKLVYYARALPETRLERLDEATLRARLAAGVPDWVNALRRIPEQDAAETAGRIDAHRRAETRLKEEAHGLLARLFRREKLTDPFDGSDPLAAAARRTARLSKIDELTFPEPGRGRTSEDVSVRLNRAADANRLRILSCPLTGPWWREEMLPMLVCGRSGATVWSVRRIGGRTVAWDGATGREFVVDAAFATELASVGWLFVRPFPSGPVSWREVVRCYIGDNANCLGYIVFLALLTSLLSCVAPIVTSLVFSEVVPNADRGLLAQIAVLSVLFVGLACVVNRIGYLNSHRSRFAGCYTLQLALFDRTLRLNTNFFRNYNPQELASRLTACVVAIRKFGASLSHIIGDVIGSLAPMAMLFYYVPSLAGMAIGVIGLHLIVDCILYAKVTRRTEKIVSISGRLEGQLERFLHGAEKIRSAGAATNVYNRWAHGFADMETHYLASAQGFMVLNVLRALLPISLFCTTAAIVVYGYFHGVAGGAIALADFAGFTSAVSIISANAMWILHALEPILRGWPSFRWMKPILDAPEEPSAAAPGLTAESYRGAVELDHVSFAYPGGRQILNDVSIKAEPGEFIALTGESGAGKSTALRLLLRFETPDAGSVLYDGKDVAGIDMKPLRAAFGVVMQTAATMPDTIFRNIVGYGSGAHTEDEVWEAARLAGCEETIRSFPDGLQTVLADGTVSGGQRQRFLLAQAFLRKPKIFFLDEATSALDNATQKIVVDSLARMQATRVVIAHRLSTIVGADRIYYLDHGRIAEVGTYAELMAKNGLFAHAARRQMIEES